MRGLTGEVCLCHGKISLHPPRNDPKNITNNKKIFARVPSGSGTILICELPVRIPWFQRYTFQRFINSPPLPLFPLFLRRSYPSLINWYIYWLLERVSCAHSIDNLSVSRTTIYIYTRHDPCAHPASACGRDASEHSFYRRISGRDYWSIAGGVMPCARVVRP